VKRAIATAINTHRVKHDGVEEPRCFLDLDSGDPTPDEITVQYHQHQFCQGGAIFCLFDALQTRLQDQNLIAKDGIIVVAAIVTAPVQYSSKKERKAFDAGELPKEWKDNPAIASKRDIGVTWTMKHGESSFGHKDHRNVDRGSKTRNLVYNICRRDYLCRSWVSYARNGSEEWVLR
jgi:transposase, IS5 family